MKGFKRSKGKGLERFGRSGFGRFKGFKGFGKTLKVLPLSAATALCMSGVASTAESQTPSGKAVFDRWCAPCHAAGPMYPGTTALQALYKGSKPAPLEQRTDLAPEVVKQFVRKGVSVMPFFRKTEISDPELDALAAYLAKKG